MVKSERPRPTTDRGAVAPAPLALDELVSQPYPASVRLGRFAPVRVVVRRVADHGGARLENSWAVQSFVQTLYNSLYHRVLRR